MTLDHSHTKAILIGSAVYPDWPDGNIKNIQVNIDKLKDALCNANVVGIKNPENITVLPNENKTNLQIKVKEITESCTANDNLIIYYAGHGLLDIEDMKKLYLATKDTRIKYVKETCISSDDLKAPLMKCKASNKIMILDCCFAAKAAGLQSDAASLSGNYWGNTEGVYFMMSSDTDVPSRYDPNDDTIPTFFTQKFIQTITEGADNNDEIWTLDEVFDTMKQTWNSDIAPEPINLSFKEIGKMPFCYNRYRISNFGNSLSEAELKWEEIEKNPNEENLSQYIEDYPELRLHALELWEQMDNDWKKLNEVLAQNSFAELKAFILSNPVPPVLKAALDELKNISKATRDFAQVKAGTRTRTGLRESSGAASPVPTTPTKNQI